MSDNKVTPQRIEGLLHSLEFKFIRIEGTTTTACWAFLPNGFGVGYGESACVDPANFDYEKGKTYARARCIQAATNKLWELEGYLLANKIIQGEPTDHVARLRKEFGELSEKLFKLTDFVRSEKAQALDEKMLTLILEQGEAMATYHNILKKRIDTNG